MIYKFTRTQLINSDIETVWKFFSSPGNLMEITPPYMNFRVLSGADVNEIYTGQLITYKVSPILNIPLFWMTKIAEVEKHKMFIDEQLRGPYKLWRHQHFFEETDAGVLMTDIVHYELPFSFLGRLTHLLFVKRQLANIFDFRFKKVEAAFNRL